MKQVLVILFLLVSVNKGFAQSIKYEFVGTLQLKSLEIITFKLNFVLFPDKKIEGTSVTDIYGDEKTTSRIKGMYDTLSGKLSFSEIENISSKAKALKANEFCYVYCNSLKTRVIKNKRIIYGNFTGKQLDGKVCEKGSIYLISMEYLNSAVNKLLDDKKNNNDSLQELKKKYNNLTASALNYNLTKNSNVNVNWDSQELIIDIWDGNNEDKDEIELYINDKKVLDRLIITNNKKTFVFPISVGENTVKILAVSEGYNHPCTANVLLKDKGTETALKTQLKKGETASIKIIRK